jgi:hypothetical protein
VLEAGDIAATDTLIERVGACRSYVGELAFNETTTRAYSELQQVLDTGT